MSDFNPFSVDAKLATVIERLKQQDAKSIEMHAENKKVLGEILVQALATNGRVGALELKTRLLITALGLAAGVIWPLVHFVK